MKNSFAIALLLGASVDAVTLDRKHMHKRHQDSPSLALKKKEVAILERDLASLKNDYENLQDEEAAVHHLAHPISVVQRRRQARPFAEGMVDDVDKVGETLRIADTDVASGVQPGFFDVNVAQKRGSRAQRRAKPFAEGMVDDVDKVGETLRIGDTDVASGVQPGFFDVNVAQKKGSHAQTKSRFAVGMSDEEEVGDALKMTEWNTRKAKNWQRGYKFAKKHHPHNPIADAFAMLDVSADPGAGFPNTLAPTDGPMLGKPGLPSQSNLTASPENEWQQWAQDFVDWEDNQTDMANTRLPYASTLLQVDPGAGYPNTLAIPGPNVGYPGLPSQSNLTAAPENEWQTWAQDFVDWEDNQTDMANTRLPYASTLLQLDAPVAPGTGFPNALYPDVGPMHTPGMPSQSLLRADPENEWQDWAQDLVDWEDNQTDMANTRIPYQSAFLQTDAQINGIRDFDNVGVHIVDDILLSNENGPDGLETMEDRDVPLNFNLLQTQAPNDHVSEMEDFLMEDPGIPLNMRM